MADSHASQVASQHRQNQAALTRFANTARVNDDEAGEWLFSQVALWEGRNAAGHYDNHDFEQVPYTEVDVPVASEEDRCC